MKDLQKELEAIKDRMSWTGRAEGVSSAVDYALFLIKKDRELIKELYGRIAKMQEAIDEQG